jgi:hypothetical protein
MNLSVVSRHLQAARPIPVDKRALQSFVQQQLVPGFEKWVRRQSHQDKPIGNESHITDAILSVEDANGRSSRSVRVTVKAKQATGKYAAVLSGASRDGEIDLYVNGALTPADFLPVDNSQAKTLTEYRPNRMSPIWECTHETCLPYGLYSILLHEVTHSADRIFKRRLEYSPSEVIEKGEAAWGPYVNDAQEVRAFMQQIVDEVVSAAGKIADYAKTNEKLVDLSLKLSTTWKLIEKHLNSRNKKLILKAVYDALDRAEMLKEATVSDGVTSVIREEDGKFCVRSPKNPDWSGGCFDTKGEAEKRLSEIEFFKRQATSVVRRYLLSTK